MEPVEMELNERELREELEYYKNERERIKQVIGAIGGTNFLKKDRLINFIFLGIVVILFIIELTTRIVPIYTSIEVAVLLISIKIIWLIHNINKMNHWQFWILSSIEYRINSMAKKMDGITEEVEKKEEERV